MCVCVCVCVSSTYCAGYSHAQSSDGAFYYLKFLRNGSD